MRNPTPFASLHDVPFDPVDECDGDESCFPGGGLCWPDDPLDKVLGYVSVPDDGFLDELIGFGACCSPPPPPPPPGGSREDDGGVESVACWLMRRARCAGIGRGAAARARCSTACRGSPPAVPRPRGGFDTCTAAAAAAAMEDGFPAEEALARALPLPARAPSCSSTSTTTSATSSCPSGLSSASMHSCPSLSPTTTTSLCKTESSSTELASVFHPWTVPRKRRSRPAATVRKRPWCLVSPLPLVLMPAATHDSDGDSNNGNDDDDAFSYSNSSCVSGDGSNVLRRSVGRQWSCRQGQRTCTHCQSSETPQWRLGPDGPGTLCNACGIRYKMGKLYQEYRPSTSTSFSSDEHSNRHRKVVKLREKKLKVMAAAGLPPVPMTPNTGQVLPLCKYN